MTSSCKRHLLITMAVAALIVVVSLVLVPAPLRCQGGYTWAEVSPSPTEEYLYDICALSEDNIWAVGDAGTILHYDGSTWNTAASPTGNRLHSISSSFENNIWAVGIWGTIIRYSGSWIAVDPTPAPTQLLYGVSALPGGSLEAWAVCMSGKIYYYSGGGWSEVLPQPTTSQLRGVAAIASNNVWAVGEGYGGPGGSATVLHYNGVSWSQYPSTAYGFMEDISAVSANDIWACGFGEGSALLFHYDGSGWTSYPVDGCTHLWGIHARAADDVWAVGEVGKILHYDGTTWADASGATDKDLIGVVSPAPGVVWIVGADGLILKGQSAAPTMTDLSRNTGPIGAEVTVSGTHFGGARSSSAVKFNGKEAAASDYINWSDAEVRVKVPWGTTSGPVTVTTDFGTSNGLGFKVTPTITTIFPPSGPPGTSVTITGNNFGSSRGAGKGKSGKGSSYVSFNGVAATEYPKWTDTEAVCVVPQGASPGPVMVVTSVGSSNTDKTFTVAYPTWYLAEGSTDWGYDCYITIENPNTSAVDVKLTYQTKSGEVFGPQFAMAAESQATVNPRDTVRNTDFSTKVECIDGKTIAVDRTMTWTGPGAASPEGHCSIGVTSPSETWYLAEGSSAWNFECWLLIQNPNSSEATATVTYMIEGAGPQTFIKKVPASSRATFNMADDIGAKDASIKVTSDVPVIPERAMYRNNRREGHDSIGTTAPAQDYFLAEGTTAWGFTTYVLVQNPQDSATDVTVTYMTNSGPQPQAPFSMPANSRKTIRVNDVLPGKDLSTQVHADRPIIAERAMYWGEGTALGEATHDSIGMAAAHSYFYLPDGETSNGRETWTLVQNPNDTDVSVQISYLTPNGQGNVTWTETIGAKSRRTFNMADKGINGRAGVWVQSLDPTKKIMVERAMYWNSRGAGTDTIGGYSD